MPQGGHHSQWGIISAQVFKSRDELDSEASAEAPLRLGCCPSTATTCRRPGIIPSISPPPLPARSHPLKTNPSAQSRVRREALGARPEVSAAARAAHHSRATAGCPPPSPNGGPCRARERRVRATPPPPEIPREPPEPRYATLGARQSTSPNGNRQRFDLEGLAPPPLPGGPGRRTRRPAASGCSSERIPRLQGPLSTANGRARWPRPMAAAKVARAVEPIKIQIYVSPAPRNARGGQVI